MTEAEVEQVVVEVVRQYTQNAAAGASSRFEEDLRLAEVARQMLFASVASAFAARGVSLPSRGFMLSQFLACPTPGAVRDAIRERVFAAAAPAKPAPPRPADGTKVAAQPSATAQPSAAAKASAAAKPRAKPKAKSKVSPKRAAAPKKAGAKKTGGRSGPGRRKSR